MQKLLSIILFISGIFATTNSSISHFQYVSQSDGSGTLNLNIGDIEFDSHEDFQKIKIEHTGQLLEIGMPDLPTFSSLYMVDKNVQYNFQYEIIDSYTIENINILPYIEDDEHKQVFSRNLLINNSFSQISSYPINNLNVSSPQTMRDIDIISIEFVPFTYYPSEKRLVVYNNVDINITPLTSSPITETIQYSRPFVKMYESLIPNFTRTEDMEFQEPAILVIGGGNALTNNNIENLLDWRHKRGYTVYTASTSQTGTSTNSIKNYIQNAYEDFDPKPEFVTLIGDVSGSYSIPAFTENWSGYSGKGDNPYGLLNGDDLYPDVVIGRMSVENSSDIATVVNKIIHYEKASYIAQTGTDWYESAALAGDPSNSGVSTIITNMFINDMLDEYEFENVDTQYNNGWSSFMSNKLNSGVLFLNYRGYIGVSGFGSGNINNLNNGYMLPFATVLTCDTGSFGSSWGGEALSESFFRAGSENIPKGAIASVGTATSGTHTMYNNIVDMGIYWGLFPGNAQTAGEALVHGKLHLIKTYPSNSGNMVNIFTHWNNLMGDPATHLWTDTPRELSVNYNSNLSLGSNFIEVAVNDENNNALKDALVTLLMGNDIIFENRLTDNSGNAFFHIEDIPEGSISVTVTMKNKIPHEGTISVTDAVLPVNVVAENISIYDDGMAFPLTGNNDGLFNPGETVSLAIPIKNFGSSTQTNLTVELTADIDLITFLDGNSIETITSIGANEEIILSYFISLNESAMDGEELGLRIRISDENINEANGYLPVNVVGGRLIVNNYTFITGSTINPGETKNIQIELKNIGNIGVDNISGELIIPGSTFTVADNNISWNLINANSSVLSSNSIEITANENIINGTVIPVQLNLTSSSGYNHSEPLHIQVGTATITDPLGPDQHGYYIYDSGDLGYNLAGIYDWIEIDPDYGGSGTNLNLNNSGDGNPSLQQTTTVNLPFDFSFYGIEYSQVTICTNGWITFGDSEMTSFRNYPVPGAGGPSPMIAAFWDDLKTSNNGDVYTFYNPNMDAFIIEWSDMRNDGGNDDQDFQIILYDTLTPTGDGEIKIQYKTVNNTSNSGGGWAPFHGSYATVGIEDHTSTDGLQYSFNNQYPETALSLADESALFITTRPSTPLTMGDVNQDTVINIVDVILIVNQILNPTSNSLDSIELYIADINGDGVLNVFDIIIIINIILG